MPGLKACAITDTLQRPILTVNTQKGLSLWQALDYLAQIIHCILLGAQQGVVCGLQFSDKVREAREGRWQPDLGWARTSSFFL